jgi:hypothetical protein
VIQLDPSIASRLARDRQREMLAYAEEQRLARRLRALRRASRRASRAERRLRRASRRALRLRAELAAMSRPC